eukprot:CAMPEP_0197050572 /NCGR_PEP_ID=MMETSP1384-20130603/25426_1 /TAXON_ID=29189 /ORGANISM="Ammonia sp." /LENGTH=334 /DNA_ID=CAMNT_0042482993 /DNA_START=56 /DNA_END=1056 /DNA_ORIENTATION=+
MTIHLNVIITTILSVRCSTSDHSESMQVSPMSRSMSSSPVENGNQSGITVMLPRGYTDESHETTWSDFSMLDMYHDHQEAMFPRRRTDDTITFYFGRHVHSYWNQKKAEGGISKLWGSLHRDCGVSTCGAAQLLNFTHEGVHAILQDIYRDAVLHGDHFDDAEIWNDLIGNHLQIHSSDLKRSMLSAIITKVLLDLKMERNAVNINKSTDYCIISSMQETTTGLDAKSLFNAELLHDTKAFRHYLLHDFPETAHKAKFKTIVDLFLNRSLSDGKQIQFIPRQTGVIGKRLRLYRWMRSMRFISDESFESASNAHKSIADPVAYGDILKRLQREG